MNNNLALKIHLNFIINARKNRVLIYSKRIIHSVTINLMTQRQP